MLAALACAAALWALAGGRAPRNGGPSGGPTGAPPRAAEPAAAIADQPAVSTPAGAAAPAQPTAPLVPGSTVVESHPDGTQVLDGIPCQVRQPDGTMSSRSVRITIQPTAVVPVESGATAPGHK